MLFDTASSTLVVPYRGAWIETDNEYKLKIITLSYLIEVRGLKLSNLRIILNHLVVPYRGAWIET